jgi:DHA2 family multidrug resistance protein
VGHTPTVSAPSPSDAGRWAITFAVMPLTVMQILDTSVTNVALPHIQGALSAGVEESSWVITSFLAANAIVIPATGWLTARLGRRRFFLLCTVLFTVSSFLSGMAPNLEFLIAMRVLQGLGGGPIIPMAQAILWEIFPPAQRGIAMAVWGFGIVLAPTFGPTLGGWVADNWSWRWIFYINLPIGLAGFLLTSAFLADSPHTRKPGRVDVAGLVLMVVGFGCLQFVLDRGEREDWFESGMLLTVAVVAVCALAGFVLREVLAAEPILDLTVFANRNFALASLLSAVTGVGFYSSMLLLALLTQKLMAYDAWTSGLVLAPSGIGQMFSLMLAGRLVMRVDQRALLAVGFSLNAIALTFMSNVTLAADFWTLALPRLLQGFGMGFVFVPLQTLALARIDRAGLPHAAAAISVVRNVGGSIGIAAATTLLSRRSQFHQTTLVGHVNVWDAETVDRLRQWTTHFWGQGADAFTATRRALGMLQRTTLEQAQALAYVEEFHLLALVFIVSLGLLPFMRRVRVERPRRDDGAGRDEGLPAPVE